MDINWRVLTEEDVCIQSLGTLLAEADEPVSSQTLALAFVKEWLTHHPPPQTYDPICAYAPGATLCLADEQVAHIARVTQGYNPVQGHFQILAFDDPSLPRLVAGLGQSEPHSASGAMETIDEAEIKDQARDILRSDAGPHLRHIVGQALQAGERLVNFADEWWLAEKLPYRVTWDEVTLVRDLLREQPSSDGAPSPVSPADLVQLLWDVSPEDIRLTHLATFTLNCALAGHKDFRYLRAGGWVLAEQLPDLRVQRQPRVPRIRSRLIKEGYGEEEIQAELEDEQALAETLEEEEAEPTPEGREKIGADAWQDLDHWWRSLARPEARVLLRGQHYIEGFLPLGKKGLRCVIPPSPNEIELAWFIFREPDNSEGRMEVTVDYQQGVVIGGPPLTDYLASQGILPGCYLYIHRRNEIEYDIYPRPLPRPIEVACKFVEINEGGELVTATESVEVRYEHDPDYVISETRLVDMEALWRQATELGLSFFDILVMHVFPKLAPHGEAVHWKELWEATLQGYRMGTPQAINHELQRKCFVPEGEGYYRFEPERGFGFPSRKKRPPHIKSDTATRPMTPAEPPPSKDRPEEAPKAPAPSPQTTGDTDAPFLPKYSRQWWNVQQRSIIRNLEAAGLSISKRGTVYSILNKIALFFYSSQHQNEGYWFGPSPGVLKKAKQHATFFMLLILDSAETVLILPGKLVNDWLSRLEASSGHYNIHVAHRSSKYLLVELDDYDATKFLNAYDLVLEAAGISQAIEPAPDSISEEADGMTDRGKPARPSDPSLERTRTGQLVAADLVPAGPLFDTPPAAPPSQPPAPLTWADLGTMETKYLFAGPSPLGRILNYVRRIKEGTYTTVQRGPRSTDNLDQWTVYAMVGLNLVQRLEETGGRLRLTRQGESVYPRLVLFGDFPEEEDSATVQGIRAQIVAQDEELYRRLRDIFLDSPSLQALFTYLRSLDLPLRLKVLYTQFAEFCPEMNKVTAEHRLPGLLRVAEFCGAIGGASEGRLTLAAAPGDVSEEATAPAPEPVGAGLPGSSSTSGASTDRMDRPASTEEASVTDDHAPPSPPRSDPRGELKRKAESSAKRDEMQAKTLFSHHYLDHRLPDHPEWAEDPGPILAAMRPLWDKARQYGDTWNEAQTEEEFIKPVLDLLGWSYIVQAKSKKSGQITRPDYALFADEASRDAAYQHQGDNDAFYSHAMAIGEAKYWERPLSQQDSSGRETWQAASNPSHQMVSYLVGTRAPWGILTNGRVWRLYSREVSSTASEFYEVDLAAIFSPPLHDEERGSGGEDLDAFKRFWLFFRRDAFLPDAQGKSFVQRVHEGSATYARHISDTLKELVFEEVMPEIAGGFVAYRYQQLGIREETEESLRQIYQASLSLLYKLLFLLYAEARGLLPMANPGYREASLTSTAQWAAERLDRNLPLSRATHATARYDALLALFHRVDQGDPSLGVPRYNGGLFNPATPDNQFLAGHKLSDRAVARAVDTLVRDAGQPVDYAYISVRNLGAIYEGLLENKLRVADAAAGKVELVNDKGERKASGSYYTPDYIVEYIIRHTLEPILEEREADFRTAMARCADLRRQLQSRPAESQDTNRRLRAQLEEAGRDAREAFLGIKVLDPAIGSGHFLVNAVDYLTDGIIQRMQVYHDEHPDVPWAWNPIQALVEKVRGEILAEMHRQGIDVSAERLDDTALLTRLVMKRCIYGVDLNPMAVELAKLSLWLHSFTVGAPLSFLDHHLRWGNSLIGSDVRTVEQEIKATDKGQAVQLGLFAGPFAGLLDLTSLMTEVAEQADATLADVRHSAEVFDRFQQELIPYKQVLDLWVSQFFNNKDAREFLTLFGADVLPALRGEMQVAPQYQVAIEQARGLWKEKRFFHWDLEFPEIFVDLHRRDWAQNPGFDVVIGNPPYVRQEQLKPNKSWFAEAFSAYHGVADLYVYFYERGVQLLRQSGRFGMITSDKFTKASYGEPLRRFLARETYLQHIVDFGHAPVFEDVDTFPCIAVIRKPKPGLGAQEEVRTEICLFPREVLGHVELANYVREHSYSVPIRRFGAKPWSLERPEVYELMDKIRRIGEPLGEFMGVSPLYGIKTGLNQAFLIDTATKERLIQEDPNCAKVIKPYLRGQDIKRWAPDWAGLWMILLKSSDNYTWPWSEAADAAEEVFAQTFPAIYRHLKPLEAKLRRRQDKGRYWWELRSCAYYQVFEQPKLTYQEIQFHPAYSYDESGYLTNNKVFILPNADQYVLAVVNSPLMWWYNWRHLPHMKDEALSPKGELMETLPIAPPTDTIRAEVEPAVERLIALTREQRKATNEVLDWLSIEFDVKEPGQRLRAFTSLDEDTFAKEVKRRRPRSVGSLSPASLHILRDTYAQHVPYIRSLEREVKRLEQQLATLVNTTYSLTPEEVDLLWRTAPPRMPIRPSQ